MEVTYTTKQDKKPINLDVKGGLEFYLPNLAKFISMLPGQFGWAALNSNWNDKVAELRERQEKEGLPKLKLTLLILCANTKPSEPKSVNKKLLEFIDDCFIDLMTMLEPKDYNLIRANIKTLLEFDEENFITALGEIFILNSILHTKQYKLLATEYRVLNEGPKIDFLFLHLESGKEVPVEVVNISVEDQFFGDNTTTDMSLRGKLTNKLLAKNKSGINYALVPVIWAINTDQNHNLIRLIQFFKDTNFQMERVQTPFVHSCYTDQNGTPIHVFCAINDAFLLNSNNIK